MAFILAPFVVVIGFLVLVVKGAAWLLWNLVDLVREAVRPVR